MERTSNIHKRKRYIFVIFLSIILLGIIVGFRIWDVNHQIELPEVETYEIGEFVDLGSNIFLEEYEAANGYQVRVNSATLVTFEEFLEKHSLNADEVIKVEGNMDKLPDYIYDLNVTFVNTNVRENGCGINLENYCIYANNFSISIDAELYSFANEEKKSTSMMFSLQPESELDFCLPFAVVTSANNSYLSKEILQEQDLYLYVSLYPVQNQIKIYSKE